jgi:hypothetical protein
VRLERINCIELRVMMGIMRGRRTSDDVRIRMMLVLGKRGEDSSGSMLMIWTDCCRCRGCR